MKTYQAPALIIMLFLMGLILLSGSGPQAKKPEKPLYLDPGQPLDKRVEDLLGRMTLEEKIGQMNMPCVRASRSGSGASWA
jgi:beta-glucosidase